VPRSSTDPRDAAQTVKSSDSFSITFTHCHELWPTRCTCAIDPSTLVYASVLYNALKSLASSLGSTILPLTSILILAPSSSPKMPSSIISPRRSAADKEDLSLRRVFASWVFRLDLGILARSWVIASLRWPHSYRAGGGETPKMKALG